MPTTRPQPINVLLVATVSAVLHAGTAVLVVPPLSFLFLIWGTAPEQFKNSSAAASDGMVLAIVAPLLFGIFGFLACGMAALVYNLFANDQEPRPLAINERERVPAISVGKVA